MMHQFALYNPTLSDSIGTSGEHFTITDSPLIQRMSRILRLSLNDSLILFDNHWQVQGTITAMSSKAIDLVITKKERHQPHNPSIIVLMPLIKKDAFEAALYHLTTFEVATIIPYRSIKTHASNALISEERLKRIVIAAAEQSKQYILPEIMPVMNFEHAISQYHEHLIMADPAGEQLLSTVHTLQKTKPSSVTLVVGPEGDLTPQEKKIIGTYQPLWCRLTPAILRSQDAISLLAGTIRASCTY